MKKILSICAAVVGISFSANAQKFCYVDVEYILGKMPEYANAQKKLDKVSQDYQKEVDAQRKAVEDMYKSFQSEQVLMTDQMKQLKIAAIDSADKQVKDLQRTHFGPNGDLFKKRQEFVKPIQDKLYNEIQKFAQNKGYDFVFDKSSGPSMLYASEKFNKSSEVLGNMGLGGK
ncbi:MAG TPA: OmpH family outer membrane protein [Chitinophagales bacterium]